jgi:hypothetical protein
VARPSAADRSDLGSDPLTFTAAEAVEIAHAMPSAVIVPLHFEGWEHFSESRGDVEQAFATAAVASRLVWPVPGKPIALPSGR